MQVCPRMKMKEIEEKRYLNLVSQLEIVTIVPSIIGNLWIIAKNFPIWKELDIQGRLEIISKTELLKSFKVLESVLYDWEYFLSLDLHQNSMSIKNNSD